MRRRKTGALTLGVSGLLASAMITGCTPSGEVIDSDWAQVCQDKKTELRVDDNHCSEDGRAGGYYGWYFYQSGGGSIPSVGNKLSGGTTTAPSSGTVKSGVPSKGGTVARGGFGSSAKGGGSIGG